MNCELCHVEIDEGNLAWLKLLELKKVKTFGYYPACGDMAKEPECKEWRI